MQSTINQEPKETQIYYQLLKIKAHYKNHSPCTSIFDSILSTTIDYYQKHPNHDKLMEAYYYKGCLYDDWNDSPQALKYYLKALNLSSESKKYKEIGLIYNHIGTIYTYEDIYDKALLMQTQAQHYLTLSNDSMIRPTSFMDIARIYSSIGKKDSAIHYYTKGYQWAEKIGNIAKRNLILGELGGYYIDCGMYSHALEAIKTSSNTFKGKDNWAAQYFCIGELNMHSNNSDSARYYFQKSIEIGGSIFTTAGAYRRLSQLEETVGSYKEALRLLKTYQQWQDSIKKNTQRESIEKIHSLYNYQHKENENQKLKEENMYRKLLVYKIGIASVILLILSTTSIFYERFRKQKQLEEKNKIQEMKDRQYAQSTQRIKENEQQIQILQKQLLQSEVEKQELIEIKMKSLETDNLQIQIQQEERTIREDLFRKSPIYIRFHHIRDSKGECRIREEDWEELQKKLDDTYNNFTGQLHVLHPKISQIELQICYLIKSSVNVTTMSQILNRSKSSVSSARSKLYERLQGKKGTPEMLDKFIKEL